MYQFQVCPTTRSRLIFAVFANIIISLWCLGANILKVYSLGKRLIYSLIKSDKNYRSYYLRSLTVVLYILYVSAYQINFQFKYSHKFWRILIAYRKMCQFQVCTTTRCRVIFLFLQILLFLFAQALANFWWSFKSKIDTFSYKQWRSVKNYENIWSKSSVEKI